MIFNNKRILFIFLIFFLLILGACSGNKETGKEQGENSSKQEETKTKEPKHGGTYTILNASDIDTLDPHRGNTIGTHFPAGFVYNRLLTYETGPDVGYGEYKIAPDLAEKWEISDDGLVYTFHLREAYFHDIPPVNGRKLVAEDVVATMERIKNLPGHQVALLEPVEKIEAKDEKTVVFTLKRPFAPFLNNMANHFMWILPKEAIDGEIDLAKTAIGTGPFMLKEWELNVKRTFVRNPNYYEKGKPYLDKIEFLIVPDQGAHIAAFRTGKAEAIDRLTPDQLKTLKKSNPDAWLWKELSGTHVQTLMNTNREPFQDIRVRKAISMAIDRKKAVDSIFGGGELSGPINSTLGDWVLPKEERESLQPYDPEKAKQLLAEAGYPNGFDTTILTTEATGPQIARYAEWVAEDLRKIGINAEIKLADAASFIQGWVGKKFDILITFNHFFQEPDEWLYSQYKTGAFMNSSGISDPKLDEMLEEQRTILDREKRKEKIYEIQRYILENVVTSVAVTPIGQTLYQPYVKDVYPHASYGGGYFKDIWFDK
jgi:peptide/nickel transport system substrate-binding protein